MQITYKGDYALKAILGLALNYGKGVVKIHDLAENSDIPFKFLEQVLLDLKRGGFVDSKRGINGGYFLTREPSQITLGEVVRFIDGPIEPVPCATNPHYKGCQDLHRCVFKGIWREINYAISNIVDNITFQDLVERFREEDSRVAINYQI